MITEVPGPAPLPDGMELRRDVAKGHALSQEDLGEIITGEKSPRKLKAENEELRAKLARAGVEAVAINLLFSFLNPQPEQIIKSTLEERWFVSASHEVRAEAGEYERGITTWLNASLTVDGALHVTGGVYDGAAVGFMAAKTADQTNAAGNELITFDTVITNVGGGYDSATSTFTAPYDGLYHLSAVVLSDYSTTTGVNAKLYKNGVTTKISGWATGEEVEEAVLSAVLVLQQGDAMTIVNGGASDGIHGESDNYHTHFEGHLINRM